MTVRLPDGWTSAPLGSLIDPDRPITYGVVQPGEHDPDGIPLVRGTDYAFGWRPLTEFRRVSPSIERQFARARLRAGDIVITIKGDVGNVAMVPDALEGANLSQTNARIAVNRAKAHPQFVLQFLRSDIAKKLVAAATKTGAQPGLIFPDIEAFRVPFPPIGEQCRIAAVLNSWDDALDTIDRLIGAKERLNAALSRKLFDPCHSTFSHAADGWEAVHLADAFSERDERDGGNLPLLSVTMDGGVIPRAEVGRKDTSPEDKSAYKRVLPGDIAYNTMRMWQGVSGLSRHTGIVSPAYTVVIPDEAAISGGFAAYLFKAPRMIFDFERHSQGLTSDTWNLKWPALSSIRIWLPPLDYQARVVATFDALHAEISMLKRERQALQRQKRGLMQKLLTGEWRAPETVMAEVA